MFEIFDEIFDEVCVEFGLAWYEVFDSERFDEVERRIGERFHESDCFDIEGFPEWYEQYALDL